MNQKTIFLICVLVAVTLLFCSCFSLSILIRTNFLDSSKGISLFSVLLDIIIGFFTIWGLYWGASEFSDFAARPRLQLLPGKMDAPRALDVIVKPSLVSLVSEPPFRVNGWFKKPVIHNPPKKGPHLECGIFLVNTKPKEGRYIHLVMRVSSSPTPSSCKFQLRNDWHTSEPRVEKDAPQDSFTLSVLLPDELVVYQSPVFIGDLIVRWDTKLTSAEVPRKLLIYYDVYTLDGASRGKMDLGIDWEESTRQSK